jgi:glycolate oxidase iron-sulfur subunit
MQLRDNKLANLAATNAEMIVSANIGCLTHLQSGTDTPVRHWIELIDRALRAR